jgi:hypothetical protein
VVGSQEIEIRLGKEHISFEVKERERYQVDSLLLNKTFYHSPNFRLPNWVRLLKYKKARILKDYVPFITLYRI